MIKDVKNMLEQREWKVSWVRRSANGATHKLAKEGLDNNLNKVWVGDPLECILRILSAEIPALHD